MDSMDTWRQIPKEKRDKLFQATVNEFSTYGYQLASTNRIIQMAEISKGLLFHYFGSKKNLYLATTDLIMDSFVTKFYSQLNQDSDDIFEKILIYNKHKFKLLSEHPMEYKIIMSAYLNVPDDLKQEIQLRYQELSQANMAHILKNIDYSKFRTDISPHKAIEFIFLAMEGVGNKYAQIYKGKEGKIIKDLPKISAELEEYLAMLKHGMYIKEG